MLCGLDPELPSNHLSNRFKKRERILREAKRAIVNESLAGEEAFAEYYVVPKIFVEWATKAGFYIREELRDLLSATQRHRYCPRHPVYKLAYERLRSLNDQTVAWRRLVELTPGLDLSDDENEIDFSNEDGDPDSVTVKGFQEALTKMRKSIANTP